MILYAYSVQRLRVASMERMHVVHKILLQLKKSLFVLFNATAESYKKSLTRQSLTIGL